MAETGLPARDRDRHRGRVRDLGRIGFEGRYDYGAVGNAVILASRLSDAASPGQILISQRVHAAVEDQVSTGPVRELTLKGFSRVVPVFSVEGGAPN